MATSPIRKTVLPPSLPVQTDATKLRWGIVTTIKAPQLNIARFLAWHLDAGAADILVHLDQPDDDLAKNLAHPKVRFVQCDDAYWAHAPEKARETHQLRQAYNATRGYNRSDLDWLAHIDVDEFLLTELALADHLANAPVDAAFVRLAPVEMLASPDPWSGTAYFKRTRKHAKRKKDALRSIYPTFGEYVPEGFISYTGGKNIARVGLPNVRFGIHALLHKGAKITNGPLLEDAVIGHAHAPDWDTFQRHFEFRMVKGSYRKNSNKNMSLTDIFGVIIEDQDVAGLRAFYDEMCVASPERLDLLAAHDMLLTWRMDLDQRVARHFRPLGV